MPSPRPDFFGPPWAASGSLSPGGRPGRSARSRCGPPAGIVALRRSSPEAERRASPSAGRRPRSPPASLDVVLLDAMPDEPGPRPCRSACSSISGRRRGAGPRCPIEDQALLAERDAAPRIHKHSPHSAPRFAEDERDVGCGRRGSTGSRRRPGSPGRPPASPVLPRWDPFGTAWGKGERRPLGHEALRKTRAKVESRRLVDLGACPTPWLDSRRVEELDAAAGRPGVVVVTP